MAERYFALPEDYAAPSYEEIVGGITETGIRFKGESVPWGIATEPTLLPDALGAELADLGPTLQNAFHLERVALTGGGKLAQQAEQFVRFSIPNYIPTDPRYIDKKSLRLMRPDIVITSERMGHGSKDWRISCGIAEVETRPAATFVYPALLEGYGISRAEYMQKWVEAFGDRPWVALYPEEWRLYAEELEAFSNDLIKHGGRSLGVHNLDRMTHTDVDEIPEDANAYLFGYLDVWARSGSLPLAQVIANRDRTVVFNPLHYYLETKASLVLFQQEWFLDELAKRYGNEHAERLHRWMIEGYVLNVEAPQDNTGQMIADHNQWVLKRAGFSPEATESKGVIMPGDHQHPQVFTDTLRAGLSGNDGQWIAQRFQRSRVPQGFYHPDTREPDMFTGSMRISPLYLSVNRRQVAMLGVMSTVSFGSERAHGGSGKEVKPGMAVMAPVAFGNVPGVVYSAEK